MLKATGRTTQHIPFFKAPCFAPHPHASLRARPPQEVKVCEQGNVEAWASTRSVKLSAMFRHISQEALNCRKWLPEARVIPKACPFLKLFFWDGWACVWVGAQRNTHATQEMWTGDPKRRACKRPASASSQVAKDNKQQKTTSSSTSSAGSSSDAVETEEEEGGDEEEEAAVEAGDEKADAKYEAKDQQKKPSPAKAKGAKDFDKEERIQKPLNAIKIKDQNRRKTSSRKRPPNQSPNPSQSPSPSPSCSPSCRQRPRQPSRQRQCLAGSTKAARQQVDQIRVNAAGVRVAAELLQGPHAIQFLGALFAFSF